MNSTNSSKLTLIPVMITFFTMGFVDLVGAVSNNMQEDFGLSDSAANFFPSLVFFWFLIFSVPTGMLMNKIGRKKTVMLSLIVTTVAVLLPLFDSFMPTPQSQLWLMYISFSLLGIGNAIMQTSINPLVTMLVKGHLASTLTFGQFVKAIASFIAPLIAAWGATTSAPILGLSWRILFLLFFVIGMIATLSLGLTNIEEEPVEGKASGFIDSVKMLGTPLILLSFIGIMCHVGIDVGTNAVAPKIMLERLGTDGDTLSQFEYALWHGCFTEIFECGSVRKEKFCFFITHFSKAYIKDCNGYRNRAARSLNLSPSQLSKFTKYDDFAAGLQQVLPLVKYNNT